MKKYGLPALYIAVTVLLLANCVREIDFQEEDPRSLPLVVSGFFSNSPGIQTLSLTRPTTYKKQDFPFVSDAVIRLVDNLGNVRVYNQGNSNSGPYYYIYGSGHPGRTYTLEIDLPNGEQYRSHPQLMPEPIPLDTIELAGQWLYTNTAEGLVVREPFAFAYARSKAPAQPEGYYLRWDGGTTYIFNELPATVQHQCFVTNRLNEQVIPIADLGKYNPGAVVYENVGRRKVDQAFELKIAFSVYQHCIGKEAYTYWRKVNQLLAANGTIFDTPPAAVSGNVENLSHPDQPALGFFEVNSVDTFRIYSSNSFLSEEFRFKKSPYCGLHYVNNFPLEIPDACRDCQQYINGATYAVPWWWH